MKRFLSIILATVMFISLFATVSFAEDETLEDRVYNRLDEVACVEHYMLDLVFGANETLDSLPEVLTNILGFSASVDPDVIDYLKSSDSYGGIGNGQTAEEYVTVTFSDPSTEEEVDIEIGLALYKAESGKDCGAIGEKGILGCCAEEWPEDAVNALDVINDGTPELPDVWDKNDVIEIPGKEYTVALIEKWFRRATGLGDDWTFCIADFNADQADAGDEVKIGLVNHDVNDAERTIVIACGPTLKLTAPDPFGDLIDEKYDQLVCIAHSKLDLLIGTSDTICPEDPSTMAPGTRGLELTMADIFGYPAEISNEDLLEVRSDYGGLGDGQTAWPPEITVTFTNPETGSIHEAAMTLALYKGVGGKYCGAIDDHGFLGCCPDDWPSEIKSAKKSVMDNTDITSPDFWGKEDVIVIPGESYTEAAIEAWLRDVTKLNSGWDFYIEGFDASKALAGNEVNIGLINHNVNNEGRSVVIACAPTLKIDGPEPLSKIIDDEYSDLCCVAHTKLDLIFGESGTITTESLGAILTELFGYPATVEQSEIDAIKSAYGGLGGGQTAWVDDVTISFSSPLTGETYDKVMDLAIMKMLYGQYAGALNEERPAYFGTCPDDWPTDAKSAGAKLNTWDEEYEIEIPAKAYTPGTIEAWLRAETGLGEDWTFLYNGYDASKAYTGNVISLALMNNNVNGEGRTIIVAGGPKLHIVEGEPMNKSIDDMYAEFCCEAHTKLDLVFGTRDTLDHLNEVLTSIFEFPATVDPADIEIIKDNEHFGGLGNGQTAWCDNISVTFTNPTTGDTYQKAMDLAIFKSVIGLYAGAIDDSHPGFFGICPDDWTAAEKEAAKLNDLTDEDVIELIGEAYTPALLEEWFRGQAKLGDGWKFFCDGLNEEEAAGEGDEVFLALVNKNMLGEGRTMIIAGGPKIKFKTSVVPEINFTDVPEGEYYYDAVAWAVANKITTGTTATTFSPNDGCTRGQVVTFLWRSAGQPEPTSAKNPFKDVPANEYYYKAVLWAVEKGITNGTDKTHFSPEDTCTRAQIVTFLYRWQGQPKPTTSSNPFRDVKSGEYFYNAVLWAVEKGITTGTDKTHFSPEDTCTRAQVVTFMFRGK